MNLFELQNIKNLNKTTQFVLIMQSLYGFFTLKQIKDRFSEVWISVTRQTLYNVISELIKASVIEKVEISSQNYVNKKTIYRDCSRELSYEHYIYLGTLINGREKTAAGFKTSMVYFGIDSKNDKKIDLIDGKLSWNENYPVKWFSYNGYVYKIYNNKTIKWVNKEVLADCIYEKKFGYIFNTSKVLLDYVKVAVEKNEEWLPSYHWFENSLNKKKIMEYAQKINLSKKEKEFLKNYYWIIV